MAATDRALGTDVAGVLDAGFLWGLHTGRENLKHHLARRFMTANGSMFWAPDDGLDLRDFIEADMTDDQVASIASLVESEALKDPRISAAAATVTYERSAEHLIIDLALETADGPFDLILAVSQVTVTILNGGLPALEVGPSTPVVASTPQQVLVAVAGPRGPAGATGPSGSGGSIVLSDDQRRLWTDGGSEELIKPVETFDFDKLPSGNIEVTLAAQVKVEGGATGTFRIYVGGTDAAIDGTFVASFTTTSASYEKKSVSGVLANPLGEQLVKVTFQTSSAGQKAWIKGRGVIIKQG